jgi:hypothetical protein
MATPVDATDLPLLPDAYPLAAAGLDTLRAVLAMSAVERRAHFAALTADEIAHTFLAMKEVQALAEDAVIMGEGGLHEQAIDRFVSQGSKAVERALRAHPRESPVQREVVERLRPYTVLRGATAEWLRRQAHQEALAEAKARELEGHIETLNVRAILTEALAKTRARRVSNPVPPPAARG